MGSTFTTLDLILFFAALVGAMAVGLIAGRKEDTSEDYFLAGRKIPWFGVAGSIFGSNVSANHMVGMMGIGFSIGFAQSHFEIGAIAGLMMLCYGFLPVYRKLNVFTLSEYLARRYDERSRVCYAVIMVIIMAIVHLVPGLYIGARSICFLAGDFALQEVPAESMEGGEAEISAATTKLNVHPTYYMAFVIALAVISASYTILGGLKAVIWTDVIQSVLLLAAGIVVALLVFREVGGWEAMMALDRTAAGTQEKMRLYLPMNHPGLPWTGVFTGLMAMHCFYWGTNQFIVQRALGARSDAEARLGIIAAGYLKLLIPFFSIAAGIAAFYLFQQRLPDRTIAPDTAFTEVVRLVIPVGYGVVGLIAAGLIGAILSSIDSMMNSAATIVTIDIYKRYINPAATDRQMILVGRLSIVAFVVLAAVMAIWVLDPNSQKNFFLEIADKQNYLTPGLLVTFLLGMFWRRGTALASFVTILAGIACSWALVYGYDNFVGTAPVKYQLVTGELGLTEVDPDALPADWKEAQPHKLPTLVDDEREQLSRYLLLSTSRMDVIRYLGPRLNFFHRVVGVILLSVLIYVAVSMFGEPDQKKNRLTWTDLGGHDPAALRNLVAAILVSLAFFAVLGFAMVQGWLSPPVAAVIGAVWTFAMFFGGVVIRLRRSDTEADHGEPSNWVVRGLTDDRFWAGLLCALAVFMLFYFY